MTGRQDDLTYLLAIDPGDVDADVDVTEFVQAFTWRKGRDRETDQYKPASGTLTLLDQDRRFDPNNDDGPYSPNSRFVSDYGGLIPLRRLTVELDGVPVFVGFVTDWAVDYADGDRQALVTVPVVDALGILANSELDTIVDAHSGDTSGVRVQRVLDRPEVDYTEPTAIDTGISTFGDTTFGGNALEYLRRCAQSEGGYLFVDREGVLQFLDRHTLLNDATGDFTFTDAHVGSGILYKRLAQSSAADLLYNRATGAGTSGTEQAVSDAASMEAFRPRTLPLGRLLLLDDAEVESLLEWHVQRFKDPEARFSSIELNTMSLADADAETVALLDLATLVTVERVPLGDIPAIRYINFPGTASNYVSAPDAGDIDVVGDICLVVRIAPDDWTPATAQTIFSKWTNTGNQRAQRLDLTTAGTITFQWSTTGSDTPSHTSSVAAATTAGVSDGEWLWLALTLDVDDGAGGRDARFWYSTDPHGVVEEVTWTQLGATQHAASTTSIFASTAVVNISGHTLGVSQPFDGKVSHASIRAGIPSGGAVGGNVRLAFDGDQDLANVLPTTTSFLASTGETLTVNGTLTFGSVAADTVTRTCIVDGIEHVVTPGSWETVIRLGNADTRPFLVLNNVTFGKLNQNRLAF